MQAVIREIEHENELNRKRGLASKSGMQNNKVYLWEPRRTAPRNKLHY